MESPEQTNRTAAGPESADSGLGHTLGDGTRVLIRRIRPDDKERLQAGMQALSMESRYRRFMGAKKHLSAAELRYLTEVDHLDHQAWIVLDPSDPAQPGLGVARWVRLPDEPRVAEAAITIVDSFHGRGLGTLLLRVMAGAARERGIDSFRAYVLADNAPMLHILAEHNPVKRSAGGSVLLIDLPICPARNRASASPQSLLRAVARRTLPNVLNPFGNG